MKKLRDLEDLTIHDGQPISDSEPHLVVPPTPSLVGWFPPYHSALGRVVSEQKRLESSVFVKSLTQPVFVKSLHSTCVCKVAEPNTCL